MNAEAMKKSLELSAEDLARLGGGAMGYIREIDGENALKLMGGRANVPAKARLFCLYGADGTPVSISGSHEAAIGSAFEHDLLPMSVH